MSSSAVVGQHFDLVSWVIADQGRLNSPEVSAPSGKELKLARRRSFRSSGGGVGGAAASVVGIGFVCYFLLMFVINFVPEIETAVTGFTTTLPMVEGAVTLFSWMLPAVLLFIGILLIVRRLKA